MSWAAILAIILFAFLLSPSASRASTARPIDQPSPSPAESRGQVVHRVVWDDFAASDRGIHLDSANIDGTNRRSVYDQPRGFTMYLTMDPSGTHVAFSTCCRDEFPALVVVPVLGGKALKPLAHHRDIYFVGGIGWSPDGKRLAFEGSTRSDQKTPLWTVKPDGTQLRHVLTLRNRYINPELAWTPKGILYSDGRDMRRAAGGSSHVVMSHVWSLRMSGDGQHILTNRIKDGKRSVWYSATDGTARVRLYGMNKARDANYWGPSLNFAGTQVLALRVTRRELGKPDVYDVVTWDVAGPPEAATSLPWIEGNPFPDWN